MAAIHQIYCTHCTYAIRAEREGDLAGRMLAMSGGPSTPTNCGVFTARSNAALLLPAAIRRRKTSAWLPPRRNG